MSHLWHKFKWFKYFWLDRVLDFMQHTKDIGMCTNCSKNRSLVECSNMGDISRAIRQLAEGYHLDTGTTSKILEL